MYAKILLMTAVLLTGQVYAQTTPSTTPVAVAKKKKKKKPAQATAAAKNEVNSPAVAPVEGVKKEEGKKEEVKVVEPAKPASVFQYMKNHFAPSYHGEYVLARRDVDSANEDDHKIQDLNIMHQPTLIYKITPNWQVMATAEFKYTDVPGGIPDDGYKNNYFRGLFTVTRKNILVEKENGIQLDAGIGRRDVNTAVVPNGYGNDRAFATITKNFGKNNASLLTQYLYNDPKLSSEKTWQNALELIPSFTIQLTEKLSYFFSDDINIFTPKSNNTAKSYYISHEMNLAVFNYQWTDKLSTYYQFKYLRGDTFTNAPTSNYFAHFAGLAYAFTPKISLTGEVGSEIFRKDDGRKFFAKKASYPEVTVYLDLAL